MRFLWNHYGKENQFSDKAPMIKFRAKSGPQCRWPNEGATGSPLIFSCQLDLSFGHLSPFFFRLHSSRKIAGPRSVWRQTDVIPRRAGAVAAAGMTEFQQIGFVFHKWIDEVMAGGTRRSRGIGDGRSRENEEQSLESDMRPETSMEFCFRYPVIHPNWVKVSQHCCTTRLW